MNALMQMLASDGWGEIVRALLNTLWEGAVIALILYLLLGRVVDPVARHRWCVIGLVGILLAGTGTWAVLDLRRELHAKSTGPTASANEQAVKTGAQINSGESISTPGEVGERGTGGTSSGAVRRAGGSGGAWVAWAALGWLIGAAFTLGRAAQSVAGAERLRRTARPLTDETILRLIEEARQKLRLARRIRAVVTEQLTSPAVAGVLVPTLILPLSLVTTLTLEQLQFILLHELAHIRRGDYLWNLFQMLVESLLFFNPAVWWLSRQLRQEREACCDALAIALAGGERLEYARTLAEVGERGLAGGYTATPAFAGEQDRPGLKDRVRRILSPGARPHLRLSWQAMAGSLIFGGTVFLLSALGTQWTVMAAARLLTPEERIDRIEANLKDLGQEAERYTGKGTNAGEITLQVRTADGSPLPHIQYLASYVTTGNSASVGPILLDTNGVTKLKATGDEMYVGTWVPGYAPVRLGPIDLFSATSSNHLELVLERGFGISIEVVDADSGKPVPEASLSYLYAFLGPNEYIDISRMATADGDGVVHLTNCAPLPLHVSVQTDGYESGETVFDHLRADDRVKLSTRRAQPIAGKVTDAANGRPINGAGIYLTGAENVPGLGGNDPWRIPWDRGIKPMAVTDADGDFNIESLPRSGSYELMAQVAGHASVIMEGARPGQTNLSAALGPQVVVRGRIEGDLSALPTYGRERVPHVDSVYIYMQSKRYSWSDIVPLRIEHGAGYFEFTNLTDGPATIRADGKLYTESRVETTNEWVIKLPESPQGKRREVAIRFVNATKVAPKGTIALNLPGRYNSTGTEVELTNGEAHCEALIGNALTIGRGHMVGFWFNNRSVAIVDGTGPQLITIDTIPAGAIYAEAHNRDGTLADDALFALRTVKRSPHEQGTDAPTFGGQSLMGNDRRRYAAGPLPLDGTYQVIAYRGNNFCASEPVTISAAEPDRKLTLQFGTGVRLAAQVFGPSGLPETNASVEMNCAFTDFGIGLQPSNSDETGRFEYDDCEPSSGKLALTIRSPGMGSVIIEPDLKKMPLIVNLQPGLKVSGQVVDQKTGKPFAHAGVFASPSKEHDIGRLPLEKTVADDEGRFTLDTLQKGDYYVSPTVQRGGYSTQMEEVHAGQAKPVVLKVTLNQAP